MQDRNDDEIQRLAPWFHNLHLPDGRETAPRHPLGDFPAFKWRQIAAHLPIDLSGWRVLDIGCNAGFYSIELARRGADVLGIDIDEHYLEQARWAASLLGLSRQIRWSQMQIYDLYRLEESFDLVLFMGVFYHLRHPLLALEIVRQRVGRLLVFQTLSLADETVAPETPDVSLTQRALLEQPGWPKMAFVERTLENDPTNWWVPNHAAVLAMLRSTGFEVLARPGHEIYLCQPHLQGGEIDAGERDAASAAQHALSQP